MENTLLVRLWKVLPEAQRRQVGRALRSPVFNQREELLRLLDFIEQQLSAAGKKQAKSRRSSVSFTKESATPQGGRLSPRDVLEPGPFLEKNDRPAGARRGRTQ